MNHSKLILTFLIHEHANGTRYFKSSVIAHKLGLTTKQVGYVMGVFMRQGKKEIGLEITKESLAGTRHTITWEVR